MSTNLVIGRTDRPRLEVETVEQDGLKVSVVTGSESTLVGYAYIGACDGGYQINRVESWAGQGNKVGIRSTVKRCLSVSKFNKLMSKQYA